MVWILIRLLHKIMAYAQIWSTLAHLSVRLGIEGWLVQDSLVTVLGP